MSARARAVVRLSGAAKAAVCLGALLGAALAGLFASPAMAAGVPRIVSQQASATTDKATPEAHIEPNGARTTCAVQYVNSASFAKTGWEGAFEQLCVQTLAASPSEQIGVAEIGGLQLDTSYEYRFIADNSEGAVTGPEATFVTYGISAFAFEPNGLGGASVTQAGAHPYELVTHIAFNQNIEHIFNESQKKVEEVGEVTSTKDVDVHLPAGLVGNPTATAKCTPLAVEQYKCPAAAQVGTIVVYENEITEAGEDKAFDPRPLYNVVPPKGVPAAFGAAIDYGSAFIYAHVRTGSDYGIDADSVQITTLADITGVTVKIWGVPGSPAHASERFCLTPTSINATYESPPCAEGQQAFPRSPFLSMPTRCAGPLTASVEADAYQQPGVFVESSRQLSAMSGCEGVPFAPEIEAQPTTSAADSPTGLNVDLKVPQHEEPEGIASADLKDATVTFPAGMTVNPSSADGLGSCSEEQVGFTGFKELDPESEPGIKTAQFTEAPAEASESEETEAREGVPGEPKRCPAAAKLGTVTIDTPLLEHPLPGALYLATPHENPFGSLIAVYLAVYDPISGVVVKLPGEVELNQQTGQITTTFKRNPQLPFEDLKVSLFGAKEAAAQSRASLTTPAICGSYSTTASLVPWSAPEGKTATPESEDPFTIAEVPGGGACAKTEGEALNSPGFEAGAVSPIAGSYSPFVLKLSREDGSQRFQALNVTLPPGLIGKVAGVQECPQADIEQAAHRGNEGEGAVEQSSPSCPAGSEVGVVHVGAGSGAPFYVTGHAYFAGPYDGAPFSFVIVTPAVAGPFDLGTVVVRAGLFIDPHTAQVTVKSDPFPTILDGIPLDIRNVSVEITRPNFTLNPTSCDTMSVTGQETSTAGQTAGLSDRFQVGGCTTLPFHPSFNASTQGSTSRKDGASLTVNVTSTPGQANIAKVDVSLPKQLPARDDTLQLACRESVFTANPAACPEGSRVGTATANTPILSSPLTGPAYLVSHGGAAFPDLELVLQGEGVTIVLDGKTNIDEKTGITSSSFDTIPDAPISTFTLNLPEGPHSILGAPAGLCALTRTILVKRKVTVRAKNGNRKTVTRETDETVPLGLTMPTTIQGQNGAVIEQQTPISVTGCPKVAVKSKPKPKKKPKPRKRKMRKK